MNMVQRDFKGSHFSFRAEELPVPTDLPSPTPVGGWRRAKLERGRFEKVARYGPSLKLTAKTPEKQAIPKENDPIPTIHFQVLLLLVSGRVTIATRIARWGQLIMISPRFHDLKQSISVKVV